MKNRLIRNAGREVLGTVLMVLAALAIGAVLVVLSGNEPAEAYGMMLKGSFGSTQKITELFVKLIPTLIMALGVSVAFRAQLWNIGAQGQFIMGSICSMVVALYVPVVIPVRIVLAFLVSVLAGASWAGLAGWLKTRFNANEVITTLMLNYIANYLLLYLINGPMQDPYSDLSQTDLVPEGMRLARLFAPYRLHTGFFLLLAVVIVMIFFWRTTLGYRIDLVGQCEKVATYSGVNVKRTVVITMCRQYCNHCGTAWLFERIRHHRGGHVLFRAAVRRGQHAAHDGGALFRGERDSGSDYHSGHRQKHGNGQSGAPAEKTASRREKGGTHACGMIFSRLAFW